MAKRERIGPPRLTVVISSEQEAALSVVIPKGMKRVVFLALIDGLIDTLVKASDPRRTIGDLISGDLKLRYDVAEEN
jgi:hypothetical protein